LEGHRGEALLGHELPAVGRVRGATSDATSLRELSLDANCIVVFGIITSASEFASLASLAGENRQSHEALAPRLRTRWAFEGAGTALDGARARH